MIDTVHLRRELERHAPFTALGALTGMAIMFALVHFRIPRGVSEGLFWGLHPLHVLLSALVTTGIYRRKSRNGFWSAAVVGYVGSIGIATLSDSLIPFAGEWLLDLPNRGVHLGFIERWWLVNPLAFAGIALGYLRPTTRLPHAGHVLLSTWASLFHMNLAMGDAITLGGAAVVLLFLFLAVWIPCCTSDLLFPLLLVGHRTSAAGRPGKVQAISPPRRRHGF